MSRSFALRFFMLLALPVGTPRSGCTQGLHTGGPYPLDKAPREGVRYYVGRDLIVLDTRVITRRVTQWRPGDTNSPCSTVTHPLTDSTLYELATFAAADERWAFRLGLRPSESKEQTVAITVSEAGLLTGINYTARDRTGEIVANVLKGVAGIAGTLVGAITLPLQVRGPQPTEAPTNEACYEVARPAARELRAEIGALDSALRKAQADRLALLAEAQKATSAEQLALYRGQDSLAARAVSLLADQLSRARDAYSNGLAAFVKMSGVGTSVDTSGRKFVFDLTQLKPEATTTIAWLQSLPSSDPRLVLLESAQLAIAVDDAPVAEGAAPFDSVDVSRAGIGCEDGSSQRNAPGEKCARIHYRIPRLRRLTVLMRDAADTSRLLVRENILRPLVSSADPILNVAFETKKLGSGSIKVSFGKYGNVTGVDQATAAAAVTGAAAFVSALSESRAEFQASLKSVADAQASVIGIQQAGRAARIKEIQDQKTLLDAEIAVQGARASKGLLLQKQQLDAELALLTSQQELQTAQTKATSDLELASLRAEIELLKVQLELLRAQTESENLKR